MTRFLVKAALLSSLLFAPLTALVAQTGNFVYGRTTLTLAGGFQQAMQGIGASVTDLNGAPIQTSAVFRITGGALYFQNFTGEVDHIGGLVATSGAATLRMQDFILDLSNPQVPVVTAVFVANDIYLGRAVLFNLQLPPGFALPVIQAGTMQTGNLNVFLSAAASSIVARSFSGTIPAGTSVGSISFYGVFGLNTMSDK